jgi:hypothetical protein
VIVKDGTFIAVGQDADHSFICFNTETPKEKVVTPATTGLERNLDEDL